MSIALAVLSAAFAFGGLPQLPERSLALAPACRYTDVDLAVCQKTIKSGSRMATRRLPDVGRLALLLFVGRAGVDGAIELVFGKLFRDVLT